MLRPRPRALGNRIAQHELLTGSSPSSTPSKERGVDWTRKSSFILDWTRSDSLDSGRPTDTEHCFGHLPSRRWRFPPAPSVGYRRLTCQDRRLHEALDHSRSEERRVGKEC